MLDQLWTSILDLLTQFVVPDWGALVGLLPVGVVVLIVAVLALTFLGFVTPEFLIDKRRHAIALITVVSAVITPGDIITITILMMVPLVLLYELSITLSKMVVRRRRIAPATVQG